MLTDTHRPSGYSYLQGLAANPSVHPEHILPSGQQRESTQPNTSRARYRPLVHLLLQDAVGCRWSPFIPSRHPCCCLGRMAGAPVMPASEGWNYLGLKPLCIGPQRLLLGLVNGVLCEHTGHTRQRFSHTKTHPPLQLPGPVTVLARDDPLIRPHGNPDPEPTMLSKYSSCLCIHGT